MTTYLLQDNMTGRFGAERFASYEDAQAAAEADGFATVRRLDEVLREVGKA